MHQRAPKITLLKTARQKGAVNQVNFSVPKDHGLTKRLNKQVKDYKWDNNNNNNNNDKQLEKVGKYQLLKDEIAKAWRMRKVIVIPVVIGALGAVSVNFKEYMKRISVNVKLEVIQKTALLGTAKILRKVLSL